MGECRMGRMGRIGGSPASSCGAPSCPSLTALIGGQIVAQQRAGGERPGSPTDAEEPCAGLKDDGLVDV